MKLWREKDSGHVEDMAKRTQGLYRGDAIWSPITNVLECYNKKFELFSRKWDMAQH